MWFKFNFNYLFPFVIREFESNILGEFYGGQEEIKKMGNLVFLYIYIGLNKIKYIIILQILSRN